MNKENSKKLQMLDASNWINEHSLIVGGVKYHFTTDTKELQQGKSSEQEFLLGKSKRMVEKAADMGCLLERSKIFEIGILQGGSVALYEQLFQPEKIVAIEYATTPVVALEKYIESNQKKDVIKPYYGVNQADSVAMTTVLNQEYPNKDIDFIFDDGAHLYDETKAAFNICFPYMKPGGLYCIEDWGWAHWPGDYWQKGGNEFLADKIPMSNLIVELLVLSASRPDLIESIVIDGNFQSSMAIMKRGSGKLPEVGFNIDDHCLTRGQTFTPCKIWEEQGAKAKKLSNALQSEETKVKDLSNALQSEETKVKDLSNALQSEETKVKDLSNALQSEETKVKDLSNALQSEETTVRDLSNALQSEETKVKGLSNALQSEETKVKELSNSIQVIHNSTSWKITQPFRQIKNIISK
jgi:hypothetical protein